METSGLLKPVLELITYSMMMMIMIYHHISFHNRFILKNKKKNSHQINKIFVNIFFFLFNNKLNSNLVPKSIFFLSFFFPLLGIK